MIPPSPELLRKYRNTDGLVKSGKSFMIPDLVTRYPGDYIDLASYESIKRSML
jgi:hypothetical protein